MSWTTDQAHAAALNASRMLGGSALDRDAATARVILDDDLGMHSDSPNKKYHLDEITRDRLIVHTRQDTANTMLNAGSVFTEIKSLRRLVWWVISLQTIILLKIFFPLPF